MALSPVLSDDVQIDVAGAAAPSLPGPIMGCQFNLEGIDPPDILRTDQPTDRGISVWTNTQGSKEPRRNPARPPQHSSF